MANDLAPDPRSARLFDDVRALLRAARTRAYAAANAAMVDAYWQIGRRIVEEEQGGFVLIDLKTGKLTHGDIGQMDMYVRMFDDLKRGADDNPTLGIVLCADKDETLVHYSVLKESQQLFASKYRLILPTEDELPAELERRHMFQISEDGDGDAE